MVFVSVLNHIKDKQISSVDGAVGSWILQTNPFICVLLIALSIYQPAACKCTQKRTQWFLCMTRQEKAIFYQSHHVASHMAYVKHSHPQQGCRGCSRLCRCLPAWPMLLRWNIPVAVAKRRKKEAKNMKILKKELLLCASTVFKREKRDNSGNINILGNVEYRFSRGAWDEMNMWTHTFYLGNSFCHVII